MPPQTRYRLGGRDYERLEDLPDAYRKLLIGIPPGGPGPIVFDLDALTPIVDGTADLAISYQLGDQVWTRFEDIPEKYRKLLDTTGSGLPDALEQHDDYAGEVVFDLDEWDED